MYIKNSRHAGFKHLSLQANGIAEEMELLDPWSCCLILTSALARYGRLSTFKEVIRWTSDGGLRKDIPQKKYSEKVRKKIQINAQFKLRHQFLERGFLSPIIFLMLISSSSVNLDSFSTATASWTHHFFKHQNAARLFCRTGKIILPYDRQDTFPDVPNKF